jgi:hypothetical protein
MSEKIKVFYGLTGVPDFLEAIIGPKYHKYLVYTDRADQRYALRAGPTETETADSSDPLSPPDDPHSQTPYGPLAFEDRLFEGTDWRDHGTAWARHFWRRGPFRSMTTSAAQLSQCRATALSVSPPWRDSNTPSTSR